MHASTVLTFTSWATLLLGTISAAWAGEARTDVMQADEGFPHRYPAQAQPAADAGVLVTKLWPGELGEACGLRLGDRILAIEGWEVDDFPELLLLRSWLPPERDHETWIVRRGEATTPLELDVMGARPVGFLGGGRDRLDERDVDTLCTTLALTPLPFDRAVLASFPRRAVERLIALATQRPALVARLRALVNAYLDLGADRDAILKPPTEPLPDPILARLERFYAAIAGLGAADPSPGKLGEDRWFLAAYFPFPALPPAEFGELHLTDETLMRFLAERFHDPTVVSPEAEQQGNTYIADLTPNSRGADAYLSYVKSALVSPTKMGGTPFRVWMVNGNPQGRDQIITELQARLPAGGPDLALYQLALVGALENREDWDGAIEMIGHVYATSPFLGEIAAGFLRAWPANLQRADQLRELNDKLESMAKIPQLVHPGIYRYCESRSMAMLGLAYAGCRIDGKPHTYQNRPAPVAEAMLGQAQPRQQSLYDYDAMSSKLYRAGAAPLSIEAWRDPADGLLIAHALARMTTLLDKPQPTIEDMAGVAFAMCSRPRLGLAWVRSAIRTSEAINNENAGLRTMGRNAMKDIDLTLMQSHRKAIEAKKNLTGAQVPGDAVAASATEPDGGAAKGQTVAGKRVGRWTITYADGHDEQGWFVDDKRQGPWFAHHPGGKTAAEGLYCEGHRVGPWHFYFANGTLQSEGCYLGVADGDDDRVGPWTWRHPSGALKEEGFLLHGKRAGTWRSWHPNGRLASEGEYTDGEETGSWLWWDEAGKPTSGPGVIEGSHKGDF